MKFTRTKHETYGRVRADAEWLENDCPMISVILDTPRDTVAGHTVLQVGKAALADQGGYVAPKGRSKASRVEQYLPIVSKAVRLMSREEDEWEELYAVGCLGLVEADAKFNHQSNFAFASFAKPYIMGYLKNHMNPERNGTMNKVGWVEEFDKPAPDTRQKAEMWSAFSNSLETMSTKQQRLMKLLYVEGHSLSQAAKIMGITKGSAQPLHDRAIKNLRKFVAEPST